MARRGANDGAQAGEQVSAPIGPEPAGDLAVSSRGPQFALGPMSSSAPHTSSWSPETARTPSQSRWLDTAAKRHEAMIRLRFGEVALRHRAVRERAGASLLPCFLGDNDPELVRLFDPPPELIEDVHLLLHERRRRARPVQAVAGALGHLFQDATDVLSGTSLTFMPDAGNGEVLLLKPALVIR